MRKTIKTLHDWEITPKIKKEILKIDKVLFEGSCGPTWKDTSWVLIYEGSNLIAYGGVTFYLDGCFLSRSGVISEHRGKGLQKTLISLRCFLADQYDAKSVYTYTTNTNCASMNSLIARDFKTHTPQYPYAGKEMVYWKRYK